jgi:hypothetical protein
MQMTAPANGRHGIEGGLQHLGVVAVSAPDDQAERRALAIDERVPLRAQLAAIRRLRSISRQQLLHRCPKISGHEGLCHPDGTHQRGFG